MKEETLEKLKKTNKILKVILVILICVLIAIGTISILQDDVTGWFAYVTAGILSIFLYD